MTKFDPTNPAISATMRHMRWEIAKTFPQAHTRAYGGDDPTLEDTIREWTNTYLIEQFKWVSEEPRNQMVIQIMTDMFGPQY